MSVRSAPLSPGSVIGILGGGQLGRMLAVCAAELGFDVHIYEPEADCPAGRVAAACVTAPWDDTDALIAFAEQVDLITFEFENVPAATLALLAARKPIRPGVRSLELTQDRLVEKRFITEMGLATAPFVEVDCEATLHEALAVLNGNAILKTRRMGYDGKGQMRLNPQSDLASVWRAMAGAPCIGEGFVDFVAEVSVVLARTPEGDMRCFEVTENAHHGGILHTSRVPARISPQTAQAALAAACQLADGLNHIGVMAVEFFVAKNGGLIVNEIAPRVHNSGHWTQDGCATSQFEQHIRAIAGWPLGDTALTGERVEMTNLIGDDVVDWSSLISEQAGHVHLYGKRQHREGRKMGHVTRVKRV